MENNRLINLLKSNRTETVKEKITVIIPLFGNFHRKRVSLSIQSIIEQDDVDLEIVLAEQSDSASFDNHELPKNTKYVHIKSHNLVDRVYFRPGFIRNIAARNSNGEFLYNTDGDILFTNPLFLRRSLEIFKTGLYRPLIRRLPIENFEEFFEETTREGLAKAIGGLDMSKPYLATSKKNPIIMRVFEKEESGKKKVFLYTEPDHRRYREDPSNKGKEPSFSTLDTHAGGILMKREHFDMVGGYCERFAGWGCHDADLQWKLREVFDIEQFPKKQNFEVLHLDHEKGYFSSERWMQNRSIQQERRVKGVYLAIIDDLKQNGS